MREQRRPPGSGERPNYGGGPRPEGASTNQNVEIGGPPVFQFLAFVSCELAPAVFLWFGTETRSIPLLIAGFLFGTFVGVTAFAWFVISDNKEQSKAYRDWGLVSPRIASKWILLTGWSLGLLCMFFVAIEISRNLVGN